MSPAHAAPEGSRRGSGDARFARQGPLGRRRPNADLGHELRHDGLTGPWVSQEDLGSFTLLYLVSCSRITSNPADHPAAQHPRRHAPRRDYTCYTTSTAVSQLFLGAVTALAVLAAWAVPATPPGVGSPAAALAPSIVFWQLQEFVRPSSTRKGDWRRLRQRHDRLRGPGWPSSPSGGWMA